MFSLLSPEEICFLLLQNYKKKFKNWRKNNEEQTYVELQPYQKDSIHNQVEYC